MSEEKVFLSEADVMVSNSRFNHAGQTYAMANITSVKATRASMTVGVLMIIIGVLVLLGATDAAKLFGLLLMVVGVLAIMYRPAYVILHTAGGEQRALESRNAKFVLKVVSAVNEAIIHRG